MGADAPKGDVDQIDTIVRIVTPENIAFEYEVAGPFRRLAALVLDLGFRTALFIAIAFILLLTLVVLRGIAGIFFFLTWFVIDWFYGSLFETYMNGQTPGKRIMGLRVVTVDGQPINGIQAVLRNVLRYVDLMPPISLQVFGAMVNEPIPPVYLIPTGMLGLFVMSLNDRYQRLGDIVTGTMVIQEDRHWLTGIAKLEDPRTTQLADLIPLDFQVSRTLAKTLATYVERRRFFSIPRRKEIAAHVAKPLLEHFGFPANTSYDLMLCALYYRTFVASHGETVDAATMSSATGVPTMGGQSDTIATTGQQSFGTNGNVAMLPEVAAFVSSLPNSSVRGGTRR